MPGSFNLFFSLVTKKILQGNVKKYTFNVVFNRVIFVELHLRAGYRMVTSEVWVSGPWPQHHRMVGVGRGLKDPKEPVFATVAKHSLELEIHLSRRGLI